MQNTGISFAQTHILDFSQRAQGLKPLSNTQSYLKYTHVYLDLNHANSLTNNILLLAITYLQDVMYQ